MRPTMGMNTSSKTPNLQSSLKATEINSVLHSEYVKRKNIGQIGQHPCIACPLAKVCLSNNTPERYSRMSAALLIADLNCDSILNRKFRPAKTRPLEVTSFMGDSKTPLTVMLETWMSTTLMNSRMFQFHFFTEFVMLMLTRTASCTVLAANSNVVVISALTKLLSQNLYMPTQTVISKGSPIMMWPCVTGSYSCTWPTSPALLKKS